MLSLVLSSFCTKHRSINMKPLYRELGGILQPIPVPKPQNQPQRQQHKPKADSFPIFDEWHSCQIRVVSMCMSMFMGSFCFQVRGNHVVLSLRVMVLLQMGDGELILFRVSWDIVGSCWGSGTACVAGVRPCISRPRSLRALKRRHAVVVSIHSSLPIKKVLQSNVKSQLAQMYCAQ